MHGGVKFYRGAPAAARAYVEADRSRADDYYLAEGTGLAQILLAERADGHGPSMLVHDAGTLGGDAYEAWVAGHDPVTGEARGRLRTDAQGLRFVEVIVNGPKTWSLAAALHPKIAAAYDAAQDRAAAEIIGWVSSHATTRVGPRGGQVQVPLARLEAAVVRHYTSRAGDPHRHLHLQFNARVLAATGGHQRWRGLHSVGIVDQIEAINGIGHAAVQCDPEFREVLAAHGYLLDHTTGEILQLAPHARAFSARAAQVTGNVDRYEATWRREHPGVEPGPGLRRSWDRRAWAEARPDKVVPVDGTDLARRWRDELADRGFTPPARPVEALPLRVGAIDRDAAADVALTRVGTRRSAWNNADLHGEIERLVAAVNVVVDPATRHELVEDIVARAATRCVPLLDRDDVPSHIRALTSPTVLGIEERLLDQLAGLGQDSHPPPPPATAKPASDTATDVGDLDESQRHAVAALAGGSRLVVIEGAAGAGKTTVLAALRRRMQMRGRRLLVVTPTLKAAQVAEQQVGTDAFSAAWLIHAHGHRWTADGDRHRLPMRPGEVDPRARLRPGDLLVVDEAGMLDQDTATALLDLVTVSGARVALMGDRHQLPAVGRGGVLDHAVTCVHPADHVTSEVVHRFSDPDYASLTLTMRTGSHPGAVFDQLVDTGRIVIHPSVVERLDAVAALGAMGDTVIADTHDQVNALNRHIADLRHRSLHDPGQQPVGEAWGRNGQTLRTGDAIATRRNDRTLQVANRERWTVTSIRRDGIDVVSPRGPRSLPQDYVAAHVELAYATTVHGAQGDTVDTAHLLLSETTGAAAVYVAMTRGRHHNTAHLVAADLDDAREQWITAVTRDRADLGPAHATQRAADDLERYGSQAAPRLTVPLPVPPHHRLPASGSQRVPPGMER